MNNPATTFVTGALGNVELDWSTRNGMAAQVTGEMQWLLGQGPITLQ